MKKKLTFIILAVCITGLSFGQDYKQAAGLRLGAGGGITYRRVVSEGLAGELMLNSEHRGTVLTFLVEKSRPAVLFDHLNMDLIYGAGIHFGWAEHRYDDDELFLDPDRYNHPYYSRIQTGVDGYVSLEYRLSKYPLILNLDCKPYIELFDDQILGLHMPVTAVGVKYIF